MLERSRCGRGMPELERAIATAVAMPVNCLTLFRGSVSRRVVTARCSLTTEVALISGAGPYRWPRNRTNVVRNPLSRHVEERPAVMSEVHLAAAATHQREACCGTVRPSPQAGVAWSASAGMLNRGWPAVPRRHRARLEERPAHQVIRPPIATIMPGIE